MRRLPGLRLDVAETVPVQTFRTLPPWRELVDVDSLPPVRVRRIARRDVCVTRAPASEWTRRAVGSVDRCNAGWSSRRERRSAVRLPTSDGADSLVPYEGAAPPAYTPGDAVRPKAGSTVGSGSRSCEKCPPRGALGEKVEAACSRPPSVPIPRWRLRRGTGPAAPLAVSFGVGAVPMRRRVRHDTDLAS